MNEEKALGFGHLFKSRLVSISQKGHRVNCFFAMDPALDVLDRALRGDAGALSFLERTASIYVLDATSPGTPTTYGCWNFINEALNVVERYESNPSAAAHGAEVNLDGHVQLLATISKRAARRSPAFDRNLIGTCLANASQYHASPAEAQVLIDLNSQLRERVMGRIASMAFDFSFHNRQRQFHSAFSNPVAMENLCCVVASNSISSGPTAVRHLVMDWIVPSVDNMPPFSVAAVTLHLASEAMIKSAPAGTKEVLKNLSPAVVAQILAPLLADAIRESDVSHGCGHGQATVMSQNNNQRLASLLLRAFERWCSAMDISITQLRKLCIGSQVNIVEVMSDSLYSDSDVVTDALAELFETILRRNAENMANLEGIKLTRSFLGNESLSSSPLAATEDIMREEERERDLILTEFISAVGLQRFRFTGRQSHGDVAVCRCLARIASLIAMASQSSLRSAQQHGSAAGLIDLLLKAAAHPSVHVCGIALEALPRLVCPETNLSIRLLPVLQRRAIIPHSHVGISPSLDASDHCGVDFHEFESFREHLLSDGLLACYRNGRGFYMESCASAVDEFCAAPTSVKVSFQLEAALFCLCAVALDASKRALLLNASPAAQAAASKASALRQGHDESGSVAEDARHHDTQLGRCTSALAKKPVCATSNPLTLTQMCRFLGKYANWYSKSPTNGLLDTAADLALSSFSQASSAFHDDAIARVMVKEMTISPFAEAATALRNILCRSPAHFATPRALVVLGGGWESSYNTTCEDISIEDREVICSGICRVLAALPTDQWVSSLSALARPTIGCLETVSKTADGALSTDSMRKNTEQLFSIIQRGADEIRLLSTMIRTFNKAAARGFAQMASGCKSSAEGHKGSEHPSLAILQRAWPCILHMAEKFGQHEVISAAVEDFLIVAVAIQQHDGTACSMLQELCETALNTIAVNAKNCEAPSTSMLLFVREFVEIYGSQANASALAELDGSGSTPPECITAHELTKRLLFVSFEAVQLMVGDLWTYEKEQGRGQKPFEGSPGPMLEPKPKDQNKHPAALSLFFTVLTSCVQRCPVLLLRLPPGPGGDRNEDGFFNGMVEAAAATLNENEIDAARSAMIFLRAVVDLNENSKKNHSSEVNRQLTVRITDSAIAKVRQTIMMELIRGACGTCPREVLDPAASLLHSVLKAAPREEAEAIAVAALQQEQFLLGDDARGVSLVVMGKCANGFCPPSVLMDFFADLWLMHQNDDAGGVAGGDVLIQFARKYSA